MASERSNRDTLFPGSAPGKSISFGNHELPLPPTSSRPPWGTYRKGDSKESLTAQVGRKLQPESYRLPDKRSQSSWNGSSGPLGPAKRPRGGRNSDALDSAYRDEDGVLGSGRTRTGERSPSRMTYHEFMVLDQAGSANIGRDNTRECNLVAIKRLIGVRKRPLRRIKPFTSDHVVSIRETYFENDDLVIIYERMDVSLRHVTSILQGPFQPPQIAAICKQLVAGLSYIHEELLLCHEDLGCATILLNIDGIVKIANIGESFIRSITTAESKQDDVRSLGFVMMELMEPTTYMLNPRSTELQTPEKWKDGSGIKGFLSATQSQSLEQLRNHAFLPTEALAKCLKAHVFCALVAAGIHWDIISLP